jgi:hypothetical protein
VTKAIILAVICVLVIWSVALPGVNGDAAVAVHVMEHSNRSCSFNFPQIDRCGDIVTTCGGNDVDCFVVIYWLLEYRGAEYGLDWPGSYSCVFTSCSDLAIGNIVNPGDGISQTWMDCNRTSFGIVGWGWIYEPGPAVISVVGHPHTGEINILDCNDGLNQPEQGPYAAGIGGANGQNPCDGPAAVRQSQWGSIKSLFR